ncbi:MAG: hypothetical protein NTX73_07195 [Rhodobacterales bacterium]|nr:hypothetical protein [Rhodobacterales bacterium]
MTGPDAAPEPAPKPKAIANPWHSRPIDVHRWSDHPTAIALAIRIWETYLRDLAEKESRPGPKPKTSYLNQLKVLVLDLYVAWLEDPELSIGLPMSSNGWDGNSRYNALHLTRKITELVRRLHALELIDLAPGSYGGPFATTNRNTRIRAAAPLADLFRDHELSLSDIRHHPDQECLILKEADAEEEGTKLVEYTDTDATNEMRRRLRAYNALLSRTFIDIPELEEGFVERVITTGKDAGRTIRIPTGSSRTFVRRIFSRGSWNKNGRFYGGWWQQVGKQYRSKIFINDKPTVEIDFKGMHVSMLSLEQGVELQGDPYELPAGLVPGAPDVLQRALIKQLVLTAINARDRKSAFSAFRNGWPTGHMAKNLVNTDLERLLDAFIAKHPHLADRLCSDQGIRLMYLDSCIAARILDDYTAAGIPVLCVHDSFIVAYDEVERLTRMLADVSRQQLGYPLRVEASGPSLDTMGQHSREVQLDFIIWRQTARSEGYLQRLEAHERALQAASGGSV